MTCLATPATSALAWIREIEIGLLVAHEGEIERAGLRLVSGIRAGDGESSRQRRLVAGVRSSRRIGDNAVPAASALHHEIAVPGILLRQRQCEPDAEFLAADALAAMDHAIHTAVRRQRSNGGSTGIRGRNHGAF